MSKKKLTSDAKARLFKAIKHAFRKGETVDQKGLAETFGVSRSMIGYWAGKIKKGSVGQKETADSSSNGRYQINFCPNCRFPVGSLSVEKEA